MKKERFACDLVLVLKTEGNRVRGRNPQARLEAMCFARDRRFFDPKDCTEMLPHSVPIGVDGQIVKRWWLTAREGAKHHSACRLLTRGRLGSGNPRPLTTLRQEEPVPAARVAH